MIFFSSQITKAKLFLRAQISQMFGSFNTVCGHSSGLNFMSFRGDPEITHEYYIKSDITGHKIYLAEGVNHVDWLFWPCKTPKLSQFLFFQSDFYLLCAILILVRLLETVGMSYTWGVFTVTIFGFHFRNKFLLSSFFLPSRRVRLVNKWRHRGETSGDAGGHSSEFPEPSIVWTVLIRFRP